MPKSLIAKLTILNVSILLGLSLVVALVGKSQPTPFEPNTTTLSGYVRITPQDKDQKFQRDGLLIMTPESKFVDAHTEHVRTYAFSVHNRKIQNGAYVRRGMHYRVQFVDVLGRKHWDQLWWLDTQELNLHDVRPVTPKRLK